MADKGSAPFPRGETFYGLAGTIDTSDYGGSTVLEGRSHTFPNTDPSNKLVRLSGLGVEVICVRNVSGITLIPGLAVTWKAAYRGQRVDGYSEAPLEEIAGIVDDHINGAAGVRNGDLFWLITKGPCLVHTPYAQFTAWSENLILYALTAAASTANTLGASNTDDGGRLEVWNADLTGNQTATTDGTLTKSVRNSCGRAMSACTSEGTAGTVLKKIHLNIIGGA